MARSSPARTGERSLAHELAFLGGSLCLVPLTFGWASLLASHDVPGRAALVFGAGVVLPALASHRGSGFARSWLLASCIVCGAVLSAIAFGGTGRGLEAGMALRVVANAVGMGFVLGAVGHVLGWVTVDLRRHVTSRSSTRN
jgi:hypothetical protein